MKIKCYFFLLLFLFPLSFSVGDISDDKKILSSDEQLKVNDFFEKYIFPNLHFYLGIFLALFLWFGKLGDSRLFLKNSFERKLEFMSRLLLIIFISIIFSLFSYYLFYLNYPVLIWICIIVCIVAFFTSKSEYINQEIKLVSSIYSFYHLVLLGAIVLHLTIDFLDLNHFLFMIDFVLYGFSFLYFLLFIVIFLMTSFGEFSKYHIYNIKSKKFRNLKNSTIEEVDLVDESNDFLTIKKADKLMFIKKDEIEHLKLIEKEED